MAATDVPQQAAVPEPRWGIGDAVAGWVVAYVAAALIGSLILAASGYGHTKQSQLPLTMVALITPPLWLGFVGAPTWASFTKGNGLVRDFGLRIALVDVPIGLVVGALCQYVLVPAVSIPYVALMHASGLTHQTIHDLSKPAQDLAHKAHGSGGILLLAVIVVIGAPIAEELFFRGLALRSVERRFGTVWAIGASALAFGVTHFELLQLPALVAFGAVLGVLVHRTGRLGTSIVAHMAFNASTVIYLVQHR